MYFVLGLVVILGLLLIFSLMYILKLRNLVNLVFDGKSSKMGVAVWHGGKLKYFSSSLLNYAKMYNMDFFDFKNVTEDKIKVFSKKYSQLEVFFDMVLKNYYKDKLEFEVEIEIGGQIFLLKFFRIKSKGLRYSILFLVNISSNVYSYAKDIIKPLNKIPQSIFLDILNRKTLSEVSKKLFDFLKGQKIIDSLVVATRRGDGSTYIHYANIGFEERMNFVVPPKKKPIVSYIMDFGKKLYVRNSERLVLPKGYERIVFGKHRIVSIYGVPLKFEEEVFGAVLFEKGGKNAFTSKELYVFNLLSEILTINFKFREVFDKLVKEKKETLRNSLFDPLTGAYNRNFLNKMNFNGDCSIIFIDLDGFKKLNDTYGHDYGDKVLKKFVKLCKKSIRKEDKVVRYGGDEFLIFVNGKNAKQVVDRIKRKSDIDFSYGIVKHNKQKNFGEILKEVDKKMYEMKKSKRHG
ncbi:diguanylate cyclase [Thermosipho sp. 1063]|uniref:sensor domain-containing diguanylate cyclase n=1 Tax=unclassified Thermosipho (in: thermotogales) TaxID=2676525 RepID=UPI0009493D6F|nr:MULTISPECIES: sensor domain-containing diguanylate cyclase [unclassified Thermosipho (in: thermotogales)]ANQ53450.1 diguanylate cyclase [Thermosipho sp. 1070]APT71899.1 diguanylate cyclase [Thermosipho sp. 1063]